MPTEEEQQATRRRRAKPLIVAYWVLRLAVGALSLYLVIHSDDVTTWMDRRIGSTGTLIVFGVPAALILGAAARETWQRRRRPR